MSGFFKTPKMPKVEDPDPLPDENVLAKAKRRTLAREKKSSGVQSTNLTSGSGETLGG